jgi:hypothetical protein
VKSQVISDLFRPGTPDPGSVAAAALDAMDLGPADVIGAGAARFDMDLAMITAMIGRSRMPGMHQP